MTAEVNTNFTKTVYEFEKSNISDKAGTLEKVQNLRIAAIATSVISGLAGLFLTSVAYSAASATFGLSTVLLVPAAACFLVCFESFKVVRSLDIMIERASKAGLAEVFSLGGDVVHALVSELPPWAKRVKAEIDQTILLSWFMRQRADIV